MSLYQAWINAKQAEELSVKVRRDLEDQMIKHFKIDSNLDGTESVTTSDGYTIKIVGRLTRKVDSERLQELAREAGLSDHLPSLFRWKAELDARAWGAADPNIKQPLLDAITTTAGRPSFKISKD